MAGHLSDVDCVRYMQIATILQPDLMTKQCDCGTFRVENVLRVFIGHRSMILSLAMSSDGRYMASGDEDGTIMMWDLASGRFISPLVGHNSCIWSLFFSCEGSLLASGSADCTVKIWDVAASSKVTKNEENKRKHQQAKITEDLAYQIYSCQCFAGIFYLLPGLSQSSHDLIPSLSDSVG